MGMGMAMTMSLSARGEPSYSVEATAYFAAMTVKPDGARRSAIDKLVETLKAGGLWSKLDWLCLHAAHDGQAGLINLVDPSEVATAVVAPTFTTDRGYTGNGTSQWLNSNWNPTVGTHVYSQNSAHLGVWILNDIGGISGFDLGALNATGSTAIRARNVGVSTMRGRMTNATLADLAIPAATAIGHTVVRRTNSADWQVFKNGALAASSALASQAIVSGRFAICGVTNADAIAAYSAHQIAVSHWGSGLSDAENAALTTAINTYLTAVGAV